jgi:predicted phosphohydrolase
MSLYAIGDLHLNFSTDKSMEVFDPIWKNHDKKIEKYWRRKVKPTDTVVITGDHSWGRNLKECNTDLEFIENLPGRKILLRGNHDMFWDAKKTPKLNENFNGKLEFLQNNFYSYEDYALVGTKGYAFENKDTYEHFEKIRDRELERLNVSFEQAKKAGYTKYIMFLHYPPTSIGEQESCFTRIADEYGVEKVVYSHCHGKERFNDSFIGYVNGIEYKLVSGDYLNFKPELIFE